MKAFLCVLIVFLSLSCFAQPKDAIFKIISSKETDSDGVYLSLHLKINDSLEVDHTVVYYLMDQQDKSILHSMSDRDGEIYLAIKNFKYIKYIYVGGPGHVTTRINLTQFKGKDVDLELVVEPDLQPLIDQRFFRDEQSSGRKFRSPGFDPLKRGAFYFCNLYTKPRDIV